MKIAIAGAGWFGCHLAHEFLVAGDEVTVFEAKSDIFTGASSHNQNRLHLGYHYPRSYLTRKQSIDGFERFMEYYPDFSSEVGNNVYAVALHDSIIDFETYLQVLDGSGLDYEIRKESEYGLQNVGGVITCHERLIETTKAHQHFAKTLASSLRLNEPVTQVEQFPDRVVVNGEEYDYLVNCTYQSFLPCSQWKITYEPCVTMMYEGNEDQPALTMMDGPFFTIYPFERNLFSVYSVSDTPLGQFENHRAALYRLESVNRREIRELTQKLEALIVEYYPAFPERFKFSHTSNTVRMKITCRSDARYCDVFQQGRTFQILSGKIDMIFTAADQVFDLIHAGAPSYTKSLSINPTA